MIRELTCIVCPKGCALTVELDDDNNVLSVSGNTCRRGVVYAEDECTNPRRTVTSTMRCEDGTVVSVKTSATVPKGMVFDIMKAINTTLITNNVAMGQILIENVCGTGVDVIATSCK